MAIFKYFDVSTKHVIQHDMDILSKDKSDFLCVAPYKEGAFVSVPPEIDEDVLESCQKAGLSAAFFALLLRARNDDCNVIRLDCDAADYDSLPSFDW